MLARKDHIKDLENLYRNCSRVGSKSALQPVRKRSNLLSKMKLAVVSVILALVGVSQAIDLFGRTQSVGAKGTLKCGNRTMANVYIKLWDEDTLDMDDQMACARSDNNGNFEIKGSTKEYTTIDPYLKIYHDCNDKTVFGTIEKPCQRKWKVKIPSSYITNGETPSKLYDNGIINMEAKQAGESRNCELINDC